MLTSDGADAGMHSQLFISLAWWGRGLVWKHYFLIPFPSGSVHFWNLGTWTVTSMYPHAQGDEWTLGYSQEQCLWGFPFRLKIQWPGLNRHIQMGTMECRHAWAKEQEIKGSWFVRYGGVRWATGAGKTRVPMVQSRVLSTTAEVESVS